MRAADTGMGANMSNPKNNRLFCRLDGLTPTEREQKRLAALNSLGLLEVETVPVFDEATQTAARILAAPIGVLSLMVQEQVWLKSTLGLSSIGLMNQLAVSRKMPRGEAFCTFVVESQNSLVIEDTLEDLVFSRSSLSQHYGIRAYLGVPLIQANGECLGSLEIMDVVPRQFSEKDIQFLVMTARWCLSEFERSRLWENQQRGGRSRTTEPSAFRAEFSLEGRRKANMEGLHSPLNYQSEWDSSPPPSPSSTDGLKVKLLAQLTQELKTPLTSVMGMASVLGHEVYGPLTRKQKEYLDIIHNSGQHLLALVEEIVNLGVMGEDTQRLNLTSVDIEMLCQQAINKLSQMAQQQEQEIRLSVEPGNRIWLLDKEKVRQTLYYLIFSVVESAEAGGEVRVHVSRKASKLQISVWVSHPWLGDGLPQMELYSPLISNYATQGLEAISELSQERRGTPNGRSEAVTSGIIAAYKKAEQNKDNNKSNSREILGLLLSCQLAEMHGGKISVQGSLESGYRYVLNLPQMSPGEQI
ncbi:MAG: GAF domain-containing sensor histidine kinase [Spirulinaceae cyanobacterium]